MHVKKTLVFILLGILGVAGITGAAFNPHDQHNWDNNPNYNPNPNPSFNAPPAQMMARNVLQRTARYINQAQEEMRMRRFRQGIGMAVSHQRQAMELFRQGWYERTIAHSIRARKMAISIIQRNHGQIDGGNLYDDYDDSFIRIYTDNILDSQVRPNRMNDDDGLRFIFDINF